LAALIRVYERNRGRRSGYYYASGLLGGRGSLRVDVVVRETAWVEELIKVTRKDLLWKMIREKGAMCL